MKNLFTLSFILLFVIGANAQALFIDSTYYKSELYAYKGNAYVSLSAQTGSSIYNNAPAIVDGNTGAITVLSTAVAAYQYFGYEDYVYFVGIDTLGDSELWRTDGTPQGTIRLKNINPTGNSVDYGTKWAVGGKGLIFQAYNGSNYSLWETDGTPNGTVQVVDYAQYPSFTYAIYMQNVNGKVFLLTNSPNNPSPYAFSLDNTTYQMTQISTVPVAAANGWFNNVKVGNSTYITCVDYLGTNVIKTDGNTATIVYDSPDVISSISSVKDNIVFGVSGNGMDGVYIADTSFSSVTLVKDFDVNTLFNGGFSVYSMVAIKDTVFFVGTKTDSGAELWRTDGTTAGTTLIKDIFPGSGNGLRYSDDGFNINNDGNLNYKMLDTSCGKVFFQAVDSETHVDLWTSDGTTLGTTATYPVITSLTGSYDPESIKRMSISEGKIFFNATYYSSANLADYMWMINTCDDFSQSPTPNNVLTLSPINNIKLYPNPAEDEITISGFKAIAATVTNAIGQKLQVRIEDNKLNISGLLPGVYYLTLTGNIGKRKTVSFIKK